MPDIEITPDQLAYLEQVRAELEAQAGRYAHVRHQDVLQFLIDAHDGEVDVDVESAATSPPASSAPTADQSTASASSSDTGTGATGAASDDDKLTEMMNLLDTYDDKWDESASADHRYCVELPDGSSEDVRTKDDVRALLFKHYR